MSEEIPEVPVFVGDIEFKRRVVYALERIADALERIERDKWRKNDN